MDIHFCFLEIFFVDALFEAGVFVPSSSGLTSLLLRFVVGFLDTGETIPDAASVGFFDAVGFLDATSFLDAAGFFDAATDLPVAIDLPVATDLPVASTISSTAGLDTTTESAAVGPKKPAMDLG